MQTKVYFAEKPVFLCDEITPEIREIMHHPDAVFLDELSTPAINSLLHEIRKPDFHAGIILSTDLKKLQKAFFKHFVVVEAAGGIVQNENKEILFIFRRGKWDLPKGKLEKNEDVETCARREIEEETGVSGLKLVNKTGETYHTYDEYGKHILKVSHWYHYRCNLNQELRPQAEEDITEVRWIAVSDIQLPMKNSYENIREILRSFLNEG